MLSPDVFWVEEEDVLRDGADAFDHLGCDRGVFRSGEGIVPRRGFEKRQTCAAWEPCALGRHADGAGTCAQIISDVFWGVEPFPEFGEMESNGVVPDDATGAGA